MTRYAVRAAAFALLVLASACSEPTSGPVRIVWGRHACDHCAMAISEQAFAAEVRVGPREVMRFDDSRLRTRVARVERWRGRGERVLGDGPRIAASGSTRGSAFYRPDQRTPMAYGFGAIRDAESGSVDFETARRTILERIRDRNSHPRP